MLFLGAIFLLSGGIKALDLNLFIRQIQSYGLLTQPLPTFLAAWSLIVLECFLGAALVLNYRPRPILNLTLSLLLGFTLLALYAALRGNVEDCGCFGALVKRTPLQAAAEDGVLILVCLLARKGSSSIRTRTPKPRVFALAAIVLVAATLPLFKGLPAVLKPQDAAQYPSIWSELPVEGLPGIDFRTGAHLVILMSAGCQHCQDSVPEVGFLMDELQTQPIAVVGLGQDTAEDIQNFIVEWAPPYPIGRIPSDAFWNLLGNAQLPRVLLVEAGRTLRIWDEGIPPAHEVGQLLSK
ncbi:MAG: hypothetical protein QNJ22_02160 [Desulfosarcinaceae bacterium]|nr:hypothetical protein [Desulfosarcinaceae bacterium]